MAGTGVRDADGDAAGLGLGLGLGLRLGGTVAEVGCGVKAGEHGQRRSVGPWTPGRAGCHL